MEKAARKLAAFEVLKLALREFPAIAEPKATAESQELAVGNSADR